MFLVVLSDMSRFRCVEIILNKNVFDRLNNDQVFLVRDQGGLNPFVTANTSIFKFITRF